MLDTVFIYFSGLPWLPLLLAGLAGTTAAWLTVLLLVHPSRQRGIPGFLTLQGAIAAGADEIGAFASRHMTSGLPQPRRFLEQLGPDRFCREIGCALRVRIDEHVDDVMTRRNDQSWVIFSAYTRNRIYTHVHRRLPYVVDDFVAQLHQDINDLIDPGLLARRYFAEHPEVASQLFMVAFGRDLRRMLPWAGLAGALAGGLFLPLTGPWGMALMMAAGSMAGCLLLLLALSTPISRRGLWPVHVHGIAHRHRQRFLRALARRLVDEALAWPTVTAEIFHGTHAGRMRRIMKRGVTGILDMSVFRATLQLLLGLEGFADVKGAALEKAMEVLSTTPVSPSLREYYRRELELAIEHAAAQVPAEAYAALWQDILRRAWKILPWLLAAGGLLIGGLLGRLFGLT